MGTKIVAHVPFLTALSPAAQQDRAACQDWHCRPPPCWRAQACELDQVEAWYVPFGCKQPEPNAKVKVWSSHNRTHNGHGLAA